MARLSRALPPFMGRRSGRRAPAITLLIAGMVGVALLPDAFLSQAMAAPRGSWAYPNATDNPNAPKPTVEQLKAKKAESASERMLVTAQEIHYDYEHETVSAVGQVQIHHKGSALDADKVIYDRKTNRLKAEGRVKLVQPDGNVVLADSLELTEDFRQGFVDSLRMETVDNTRFAAARADRVDGNVTVFQSGVYTACAPCKEDPSRPPLWQVKAARIIHNEGEKTIYYEDAKIEFLGTPVAWVPYMWSPDPTVKRKTGLLTPSLQYGSRLGYGAEIPVFFNLAPNYDVTLAPTIWSRQGFMMKGEWRHRLETGEYSIAGSGIMQADRKAFVLPAAQDEARGMVESKGRFAINEKWVYGWDATLLSDRYFVSDYKMAKAGLTRLTTTTSQGYLSGQGARSTFDLRAMYFLGLSSADRQAELPSVAPVLDYSYVFKDPVMNGELSYNVGLFNLARSDVDFDKSLGGKDCDGRNPLSIDRTSCLMRGVSGSYTHLSADMKWKRTLIDSLGQMFTPFISIRGDAAWRSIRSTAATPGFIDSTDNAVFRGMPTVGLEYRWPFISTEGGVSQTIEPIAQIVMRPNETKIGSTPNEDAQSLVFDDTNLFKLDKYSGRDRMEGGGRLNLGLQYSFTLPNGTYTNMLFGQSYHLFGTNSFAVMDMANTGAHSGLETRRSDYVARVYTQLDSMFSVTARARLDEEMWTLRRLDIEGRITLDRNRLSLTYANYDARPLLGYSARREGILATNTFKLTPNWALTTGARYSLSDNKFDGTVIGIAYLDECFSLSVNYITDYSRLNGANQRDERVMFQFDLRTLGDGGFTTRAGGL